MLTRRNLLLLILLVVLLGIEFLVRAPLGGGSAGGALFPGFDASQVTGVQLRMGERSVHLDKKAGTWVVREREDFFAEAYLVESFLERLQGLTDQDKLASEASSHELYGLGEGRVQVTLSSPSNEQLLGFSLGRPAAESQGSYILPDGESSVYRATGLGMPQLDPALWLNLHLIAGFDLTQVRRVELGFQDGRKLNLQRLENGRWLGVDLERTIAPAQVQQLMVFAINAVLSDVSLEEPAAVGLELPALSLTFLLDDGLRRLDLGGQLGTGRAVSSPDWGGPWVARVPNSVAESLEFTAEELHRNLTRDP